MVARKRSWIAFIARGIGLCMVAMALGSATATAQPGRGGDRIAPEERAALHAAQAKTVAAKLGLDESQTGQLVKAFSTFQKARAEERPPFEGRPDREAIRAYQKAQQDKLTTQVSAFLDEDKAKSAAEHLAGFNRGWDRMTQVILGFKLDPEKEAEALSHTLAYVQKGAEIRNAQGDDGDFAAVRGEMMKARAELDEKIAPLLSDEQKATWAEATSRGGRGDRGDGTRRGGRGDRGARDGRGGPDRGNE